MADELNGAGVSAKERLANIERMLVSIDEKLDNKASREEVAALELRIRTVEVEGSKAAREAVRKAETIAIERVRDIELFERKLTEYTNKHDADVRTMRNEHEDLARKVAYAFGGIAALVAVSDIIIRLVA